MYFKSPAPDAYAVTVGQDKYPIQGGVFFVHPDDPNFDVVSRAHEQADGGPAELMVDAPVKPAEVAHKIDEAVLADLGAARQRVDELEKELALAEKRADEAEAKLAQVEKAAAGEDDAQKPAKPNRSQK